MANFIKNKKNISKVEKNEILRAKIQAIEQEAKFESLHQKYRNDYSSQH